jgi:hypothetical protein
MTWHHSPSHARGWPICNRATSSSGRGDAGLICSRLANYALRVTRANAAHQTIQGGMGSICGDRADDSPRGTGAGDANLLVVQRGKRLEEATGGLRSSYNEGGHNAVGGCATG